MWDQLVITRSKYLLKRIIPTYVGSTSSIIKLSIEATNHSHVCGINTHRYATFFAIPESFPRMWDQRAQRPELCAIVRIIPTYVGSTVNEFSLLSSETNHSHVCGINQKLKTVCDYYAESFPRMWDQPALSLSYLLKRRIIPTYVGSTPPTMQPKPIVNESFPRMWDQRAVHVELVGWN